MVETSFQLYVTLGKVMEEGNLLLGTKFLAPIHMGDNLTVSMASAFHGQKLAIE